MYEIPLWDKSLFYTYEFSATIEEADKMVADIFAEFPSNLWGSYVSERYIDIKSDQSKVTIKRFKSREECRRHCTAPVLRWDQDDG
jgi:hypothetical protein